MPDDTRYIGDGVYAFFDGYAIWLHANDLEHPTDKICLEPSVMEGLISFNEAIKAKRGIK